MNKYEYKVIKSDLREEDLNKYGQEGWECFLRTSITISKSVEFYFKRLKACDPKECKNHMVVEDRMKCYCHSLEYIKCHICQENCNHIGMCHGRCEFYTNKNSKSKKQLKKELAELERRLHTIPLCNDTNRKYWIDYTIEQLIIVDKLLN